MHFFGKEGIDVSNLILDVKKVEKTIKNKTILHELSFQLAKGRTLALCGGNGAGKSTLIRMIVGLTRSTQGNITIDGLTRKKNEKNYLSKIGYMPDDFQFQQTVTAKETINFYAALKKVKQSRIKEVLEQVGLTEHINKQMGAFSKGMRQRMLLAQALLTNPPLLVLDEPTNGLDPFWVNTFGDMILEANQRGQGVIFSTHDLHVAERIADEVIFLYNGKVMSKGLVQDYKEIGLYETFQQLLQQTN